MNEKISYKAAKWSRTNKSLFAMHIAIFSNYNLYQSKRYFCLKLAEAFNRADIEASIIDSQTILQQRQDVIRASNPQETSFTCSFNSLKPTKEGKFVTDFSEVPHVAFLLDPAYNYHEMFACRRTVFTCVDHYDCEYLKSINMNQTFFWAHAVEKELAPSPKQEKPYDVVFIGSCYDHETLKKFWRQKMSKIDTKIIETVIDKVLSDPVTPLYKATQMAIELSGMTFENEKELEKKILFYIYYADNYMRGKDRTELIRAVKHAHVHVFGDICWRTEKPILDWSHSLKGMKNVTVHRAITFNQSLEILKQSKICLNSMPFFKNGTHERIFTGLACRSLPITSDNIWIRNNFEHNKNILIYRPSQWDEVDPWVSEYLSNPKKREQLIDRGRKKVMEEHTWDVRVQQLLNGLRSLKLDFKI